MTDTKRDAFEAWARTKNLWLTATPEGRYINSYTCGAWDGWEAASVSGGEVVAWRYLTPTGWHATTDLDRALGASAHHDMEPLYAHPAPSAPAIPENVRQAVERMCKPLHESRLSGATAEADAHSMKLIRDYVLSTAPAQDQAASKAAAPTACKGINCSATDGVSHSLECHAEHAATIAGGKFTKQIAPQERDDAWMARGDQRCNACKLNHSARCPHNDAASPTAPAQSCGERTALSDALFYGVGFERRHADGSVEHIPVEQVITQQSAAEQADEGVTVDIFDWLETEVTAISCRYHGDPSYDHDAYWMRDRVVKLIGEARNVFAARAKDST